jgi:deoxyribodipyrimidine photo-lyase
VNIVLFRRDLRVEDNRAVAAAFVAGAPVIAVYISTPAQWQQHCLSPMQADLIERRLKALREELSQFETPMIFIECLDFDSGNQWLVEFCIKQRIEQVFFNREYEVNELRRDEDLVRQLNKNKIQSQSFDDKCVFSPGSIKNRQGSYYKVFTPFKNEWMKRLLVGGEMTQPFMRAEPKPKPKLNIDIEGEFDLELTQAEIALNYPKMDSRSWHSDSEAIQEVLNDFCINKSCDYQQNRDFPSVDGTSQLSPYLAIGALSARQCIRALLYYSRGNVTKGGDIWLSELAWRDFYTHLLVAMPKLSMNKAFLDWECKVAWSGDRNHFQNWAKGQTGYPIVDAAMRQLNTTGWMHNRLRMIVASFLTKDLHIDWREGERYFMSRLIDGDFAANNGGWQWSASTGCDAQPYFRIFNPTSQGEKFDSDTRFITHWIPELKPVPVKLRHKPWSWDQAESLDYPPPIVDHKVEREITLGMYKEAKG